MIFSVSLLFLSTSSIQRLSLGIKFSLLFLLSSAVLHILCRNYVDSAINVFCIVAGIMIVGMGVEESGYSMQSVLCYLSFTTVIMFYSGLRCGFYYLGKQDPNILLLVGWQTVVYQVALIADAVIYTAVTILVFALVSELRNIIEGAMNVVLAQDGQGNYTAVPVGEPAGEAQADVEAPRMTTAAPTKVFAGPSYKLTA